jgi:hypothetical protein
MQIRKPLLHATACLQSPSKLNVYVDENDLERLELFAAALMNTGVICDVTFCRLVNIYDVSKDHVAFIYEVKQSQREILDSLTVKVKELSFFLKPVKITCLYGVISQKDKSSQRRSGVVASNQLQATPCRLVNRYRRVGSFDVRV